MLQDSWFPAHLRTRCCMLHDFTIESDLLFQQLRVLSVREKSRDVRKFCMFRRSLSEIIIIQFVWFCCTLVIDLVEPSKIRFHHRKIPLQMFSTNVKFRWNWAIFSKVVSDWEQLLVLSCLQTQFQWNSEIILISRADFFFRWNKGPERLIMKLQSIFWWISLTSSNKVLVMFIEFLGNFVVDGV